MAAQYSIIVDVDFQKGKVEQKLSDVVQNLNSLTKAKKQAASAGDDLNLTFNVANELFQKSTQIITDMVGQVYELDTALTDFKKVSDLSGDSLNDYVDQLSAMGGEVARTGKPNRYEPVCTDGKCA